MRKLPSSFAFNHLNPKFACSLIISTEMRHTVSLGAMVILVIAYED